MESAAVRNYFRVAAATAHVMNGALQPPGERSKIPREIITAWEISKATNKYCVLEKSI